VIYAFFSSLDDAKKVKYALDSKQVFPGVSMVTRAQYRPADEVFARKPCVGWHFDGTAKSYVDTFGDADPVQLRIGDVLSWLNTEPKLTLGLFVCCPRTRRTGRGAVTQFPDGR
jgi:hypothetical protein